MEKVTHPIHVLVLVNRVPWPIKEGGNFAHFNLIKGLSNNGCKVTVAALNTTKHWVNVSALPKEFTQYCQLHTVNVDNRVKPWQAFLNLFGKQSYHVARFITPRFDALLKQIVLTQPVDLVLFDGLYTAPYLSVIKANTNATVVLRQHNAEFKIWESLATQTDNIFKKAYLNLLTNRLKTFEKNVVNLFDGLITFTQNDALIMQELGCEKPILVSPFGIDFIPSLPKVKPNYKTVFHLGAMDWLPNEQAMVWFLEKVWPLVTAKNKEVVFYLAGKKMPVKFKQYASKQVVIVGEVDSAKLFIEDKHIMVVPLFAGSGIRIKIIEGMSYAKPVVTTSIGISGIEAINGKQVCIANTEAEFANSILMLLNDTPLALKIGKEAQQFADTRYQIDVVTKKIINFSIQLKNKQII